MPVKGCKCGEICEGFVPKKRDKEQTLNKMNLSLSVIIKYIQKSLRQNFSF